MTGVHDASTQVETSKLDTSDVAFRVTDQLLIPAERYYDPAFFEHDRQPEPALFVLEE